jgi:hypothetical protein
MRECGTTRVEEGSVFQDLNASLKALVDAELSLPGIAVSFATPDDSFPPADVQPPAAWFFLYDIRENTAMRSDLWETYEAAGEMVRKRTPARVDCSYLITAWPSDKVLDPGEDEHRLLGEVLKVLLRYPHIPAGHLRGEFAGQQPPLPTKIIAENQLRSLGEFWQAMGGRPKATLHYCVTVSVDVYTPTPAGPKVTDNPLVQVESLDTGAPTVNGTPR